MSRTESVLIHEKPIKQIIRVKNSGDRRRLSCIIGTNHKQGDSLTGALPFGMNDVTAGVENEFQTVVIGGGNCVDLPLTIQESNYYKNLLRRTLSGDIPGNILTLLQNHISGNRENVWENSWVWFPRDSMNEYAEDVLKADLLADKKNPGAGARSDAGRFIFSRQGRECIRVPVSYLLKLALADAIGSLRSTNPSVFKRGRSFLRHYLNDNTSPEVFSFYPANLLKENGMGKAVAKETLKRYLLTQLLVVYADIKFKLTQNGQETEVYLAPTPPLRQRHLNDIIPDSFYRELFMSPCLSGWERGEEKHHYMRLCHEVMSRSHLNSIAKLKEAGILTSHLIYFPNISNISLANNGTHISLGSKKLTGLLSDPGSGFSAADEKNLGDLAIKITEHFLPLFVGTYSAAPYRLDFEDFHPQKILGFLTHQMDFTHLRMFWRRWKKKARVKVLGRPVTPFGFKAMDSMIGDVCNLTGDLVPDFRLLDYLVALLSTEESPALNGMMGNNQRLKKDLTDMGVFDQRMSFYQLYKLREFSAMGFSGFEGRYYSTFNSIHEDMSHSVNLQNLITALAYKYILRGQIGHGDIPDTPFVESERRQIFFGCAAGIPTFYVKKDTGNQFLLRILQHTKNSRMSNRYPGYIRVHVGEYRKALIDLIKNDAPDLIESLGMRDTLLDLEERLSGNGETSVFNRLTRGILSISGENNAFKLSADDFNAAAEKYYRDTLKNMHIKEALDVVQRDFMMMAAMKTSKAYAGETMNSTGDKSPFFYMDKLRGCFEGKEIKTAEIRDIIHILIASIDYDNRQDSKSNSMKNTGTAYDASPVY